MLSIVVVDRNVAERAVSVVVITSALHAEGRQFEPGTDHFMFFVQSFTCKNMLAFILYVN